MGIEQLQVLKYILNNTDRISKTQPEIFTGVNSEIFNVMKRLNDKGIEPTHQLLNRYFEKAEKFSEGQHLIEIAKADDVDNSTYSWLKEDLRKQARTTLIQRFGQLDTLDDKQWKEFLQRSHALQQSDEPEVLSPATSIFDWGKHYEDEGHVIGSGFSFLEGTGADFKKGQLVVGVAPSGNGKSLILAHIAKHLFMTKHNVLIIAFEETIAEYFSRIGKGLLNLTDYQYQQLSKIPEDLERQFNHKKVNMGNLDMLSGSNVDVEDLQTRIEEAEEANGYKYDCIIIDYAKHISLRNTTKNSREDQEVTKIFNNLKNYATTSLKLVVTAVQSNRSAYGANKNVGAENIADSMGPMHNADFVFSMKRKEHDDNLQPKTEEDLRPTDRMNVIKLTVIKKRRGSIAEGTARYYTQFANGNVQMLEKDEENGIELWFEGNDPLNLE